MHFLPKTYQTKSDYGVIIREAHPDDAKQLLELKLQYLKNTNTIPLFDYEYSNNITEENQLIKRYQKETNSLLLVAEHDGKLIGNIDLTGSSREKMVHTAMIGMGIHTSWQNQGVGTFLIQNVLDWSRKNDTLKIIWLEVYASNKAGIALYRKMNFQECGRIDSFFLEDKKYIDKITMSINLREHSPK